MGFSPELAQEAVLRSPPEALEQAVEYCFNHPNGGGSAATTSSTTTPADPTTQAPTTSTTSSSGEPARPVIEGGAQSATTSSVVEETAASTTATTSTKESSLNKEKIDDVEIPAAPASVPEEENFQLDKTILDKFANTMLPGLMKILGKTKLIKGDFIPCVYLSQIDSNGHLFPN